MTSPVRSPGCDYRTPISSCGQAVTFNWHGRQVRPSVGAQTECLNSIQLIAPLEPTTAHYDITSEGREVRSLCSTYDLVSHV